jgi:hypothetical protein
MNRRLSLKSKQPTIPKRLDNLEEAFCQTLESQMRANKKFMRQLNKLSDRINKIERKHEGKSCIGFVEYEAEE